MLQNQNSSAFSNQQNAKYTSARFSILLIAILSVVNLFAIVFSNTYFLFSSYFTQLIGFFGGTLYADTGVLAYLIVGITLGIISVVPYLLCWIFSKKHVGWVIGAEVLFALDSVLFLLFFDVSMLLDLVIRIYALGSIGYGIKCGLDMKKTAPQTQEPPAQMAEDLHFSTPVTEIDSALSGVTRTLHIERCRAFYGCAATFRCLVDGNPVGDLKNGKSLKVTLDGNAHRLTIAFSGIETSADIPTGTESKAYIVSLKMGVAPGTLILEERI